MPASFLALPAFSIVSAIERSPLWAESHRLGITQGVYRRLPRTRRSGAEPSDHRQSGQEVLGSQGSKVECSTRSSRRPEKRTPTKKAQRAIYLAARCERSWPKPKEATKAKPHKAHRDQQAVAHRGFVACGVQKRQKTQRNHTERSQMHPQRWSHLAFDGRH